MASVNNASTLQPVRKVPIEGKETSAPKPKSNVLDPFQQNASGSSARVFTSSNQQNTRLCTAPLTSSTTSSTPQVGK